VSVCVGARTPQCLAEETTVELIANGRHDPERRFLLLQDRTASARLYARKHSIRDFTECSKQAGRAASDRRNRTFVDFGLLALNTAS
jgi:hypothetical protein